MEKQKKKQIKKYISWVLILLLIMLLAALPTIAASEEQVSGPQASILSAKAESRNISVSVLGGGTLTAEDAVEITVPAAVKIKQYLVKNGDMVAQGQPIATVDRVSVMTAITQVQETMEEIRTELNKISSKTEATKLTATAGGLVKIVYAAQGENVQDVMLRNGALAVLSLDERMAVQVNRNTSLSGGDVVCVTFSDGREVEGTVQSNLEGVLTVTVEDDGFSVGEEVKVTTEEGHRIGSGNLYINSPWNVVAYSGTVSRVRVSQGDTVRAGQTLFNLEDTGHTAQFDALSSQHQKYEELMMELFKMYQSETVSAPGSGMVTSVDENGTYMLAASDGGWKVTLLANGPGGDENTYINYIGMVTEVGTDGLIMKMNPWPIAITDYTDLSGVSLNTELMTQSTTYTGTPPIYVLTSKTVAEGSGTGTESGGQTETQPAGESGVQAPGQSESQSTAAKEWVQVSPASITAGDILLFAGGNNAGVVWVVKVGHTNVPQAPQPSTPDTPVQPGGNLPQSGGKPAMGGGGTSTVGGAGQKESDERYTLDTVTIASVTAQENVYVQIVVDELDVSKIYSRQAATVTVDALEGQQFRGTVTSVSASGENEGGNSKYTVTVRLGKIPDMLPGMRAAVSITLETVENVLCVPVAALIETGTQTQVYTAYDGETKELMEPVAITAGVCDAQYVQILSGINDGQTVYYPYYDTLIISDTPKAGGDFLFG